MEKTLPILALILLINIHSYSSKIYTWIDQEGVTHFSDTDNSNRDAKAISDSPQSIIKSNPTQPENQTQNIIDTGNTVTTDPADIQISITKPVSNETFQNARAQPINVTLTGFQKVFNNSGHIELNVDNKINRTFTSGSNFYILSPDRGKHILQAIAYSQNGEKMTESQQITFYIQNQTARNTAGSTIINNNIYQDQATPVNYDNFQERNQKQLVNPNSYNNGFQPTAKAYIQQTTGNGN